MRPLGTPQASPHAFAVPSATKAVWMPPAIIEDPDAAAVEEGEGLSVSGIIRSLIPGISLYDAYQSWKAGDYRGMFLSGGVGTLDLLSFGSISKARGLWAFAGGVMKSRVKDEVISAAAGEAGNTVGDRLGAEAGLLTEMVVSGVLSGKLNTQDQKVLGFAADGGAKKLPKNLRSKLKRIQTESSAGGNRGISGSVNYDQALQLGARFVGPRYRVMSDNKGFISEDGLRQFRFPARKRGIDPNTGLAWSRTGIVANFESRPKPSFAWTSNVHLDVEL